MDLRRSGLHPVVRRLEANAAGTDVAPYGTRDLQGIANTVDVQAWDRIGCRSPHFSAL